MVEFWESNFQDKNKMWGDEPAASTWVARDLFLKNGVKTIFIPGIGYGRNAVPFIDAGMRVSGAELSQTAIDLGRQALGSDITIHHGCVSHMPFDDQRYDGIFCHALIHLLDAAQRQQLLSNCYEQLNSGGTMIFTAVTKDSASYGKGKKIGPHRYEQFGGVQIFFYDETNFRQEFSRYGLTEIQNITESNGAKSHSIMPFYIALCNKPL